MTNEAEQKPEQSMAERGREHVAEVFRKVGLDIEQLNPLIVRKLILLDEKTETFRDEERSVSVARAFFDYYERAHPEHHFNKKEREAILIGTLLTDIGKTGPRDATPEQEALILYIYSIEGRIDTEKTTLAQFLTEHFPDTVPDALSTLEAFGLSGDTTMREFYNLHAAWTLDIIKNDGIPPEAVPAAAVHHLLEGVNPDGMVGKDGMFKESFGENESFNRVEKLIIILDKYDAFRRRGHRGHADAILGIRDLVRSNPRFADDREFESLLNDLDAMLAENEEAYRAQS